MLNAIELDDTVRRLARKFVETSGADPDILVQPGHPRVYGTSTGTAFAVEPGKEVPLWTLYTEAAVMALSMARAEIATESKAA